MALPAPYHISVPDEAIASLKSKLSSATFPDEINDADWNYGAPLKDVKRFAEYWRDEFDWRAAEEKLNELPQFHETVKVDGHGSLDVHFVWQRSGKEGSIPLLFVHGWPGSFIEVQKLLPLLRGSDDDSSIPAFDIVAPSLPNFGFSEGVKTSGFALAQYAELCHNLMQGLGYTHYATQGGDWGMYITRAMGALYPSSIIASHINMIRASAPTFTSHPILYLQHALKRYSAAERKGLERQNWFLNEGSGYRTQQGTKPQTLGYGLADSPVALLAWIYEKLHDWTDNYIWTPNEICTWISIYWFSRAGPAASLRIYYEVLHTPPANERTSRDGVSRWIGGVPLGTAYFPQELGVVPKTWGRTLGPICFESEWDRGGHFAAYERPDAIASDLNKMFGKYGPCGNAARNYGKAKL